MAMTKSAQMYLEKFGYLDSSDGVPTNFETLAVAHRDEDLFAAILDFQNMADVPQTGEWDTETEAAARRPRCGCPDVGPRVVMAGAIGGAFVAFGTRWSQGIVTYRFMNATGDLPPQSQRQIIRAAFAEWSAVVPLVFRETDNDNADIRIAFEVGDHGDGSSFDGNGGTLAHAFFPPPNAGDLAGDMHFDDAETWLTAQGPSGFDLFTVAVHEIGHALGLRHTDAPNSTMNPFYPTPSTPQADDRAGVREIYAEHIWIASLYRDVLDRRFDEDGLDHWIRQRFQGASEGGVAQSFAFSREKAGQLAAELYRWLLDRAPDQGGLDHWTGRLQGVLSREAVIVAFLTSAEFRASHPGNDQFVDALYRKLLSRDADAGGRDHWIGRLNAGTSRNSVAMSFLRSDEFTRGLLTELYRTVLRRAPDQGGLDFWAERLQAGRETHQSLLAAFASSAEYRNKVSEWW